MTDPLSQSLITMQKIIQCSEVGYLHYDEELGWYEGSVYVSGDEVFIQLSAESNHELESVMSQLSLTMPALAARFSEAKLFAAESLLPLKNGEWQDDAEGPLSENEFAARLRGSSVTFYPDQSVDFVFQDGGLFFGHSVVVSFDHAAGFTSASISG